MKLRVSAAGRLPRLLNLDPYDVAAALLLLILAVLVLLTYGDYAISNDEGLQQHYGELIIRYYASGFTDRAVFNFDNLYLYGGLFDILATLLADLLPFDLYSIRHILCAATGIGGIAATWAAARMITGPRAGLMAAIILAACGPWYGGMFNHTKDITFASTMMGATFMLMRLLRDLPRPRQSDVLVFGLLLGAAMGLRALGLFLLLYTGLAMLAETATRGLRSNHERLAFLGYSLMFLSPGFLLGYLIMIAAWPWAALDFFNPVRAILAFSHFHYPIRTLLAGHTYDMAHVPHWYVTAYLAIKLPLVMHCGVLLAIIFACASQLSASSFSRRARLEIGLLAITVGLPITCHLVDGGPAFTGLRHFFFVVPALAALAGIGCDATIGWLLERRRDAAIGAAVALAAALISNAVLLVRLHPYEYLFYNPIVGGLDGAAGRYVTDYWVNMMPEAVHQLHAFLARTEPAAQPTSAAPYVAICAERLQFERAADRRLRWTDDWSKADFFIAPTHMNCDRMLDGKVIAKVERLGVVIGIVKDRRAIIRSNLAHAQQHSPPLQVARKPHAQGQVTASAEHPTK